MKKWFCRRLAPGLCALLMMVALPVTLQVSAKATTEETTVAVDSMEMEVHVPAGYYVLTPDMAENDGDFLLAGITDAASKIQEYRDNGIYLNLVSEDQSISISFFKKESTTNEQIYNLSDCSKEDQDYVLSLLDEADDPDLGLESQAEYFRDHPQMLMIHTVAQADNGNGGTAYEESYTTIVNGYSVSISVYMPQKGEDVEAAGEALKEIVMGVEFTNILPIPTVEELRAEAMNVLIPLATLIGSLIVALIIWGVDKKRKATRSARLAEDLTEFNRARRLAREEAEKSGIPFEEPVLFVNETNCSDFEIDGACRMHFLRSRWLYTFGVPLLGLCFVLEALFLSGDVITRLLMGGLGLYFMAVPYISFRRLHKEEQNVYRKLRTRAAKYVFCEEVMRVYGIQSAAQHPYFCLWKVVETKQNFYLYYTSERCYILRKDGFMNGEKDVASFRALLKEKMGKHVHVKK